MGFADKLKQGQKKPVCLIVAPTHGGTAWYFIQVENAKFKQFKKIVFSQGTDLTQFGEILESGWGETPPQDVVDRMVKDYGFVPKD